MVASRPRRFDGYTAFREGWGLYAESALGDNFDVRNFHRVILLDGALPLNLLETKVDRWIAAQL